MIKWNSLAVVVAVASLGAAKPKAEPAHATIEARTNSTLTGTATFTPEKHGKVHVVVHVEHVKPGPHGVHIHEKGDCSDPEGKSAGGHFNPASVAHGGPTAEAHHPGDFGNIDVGEDGTGTLTLDTDSISLKPGDKFSVLGKAIIVHEKVDDLKTQPTGNAGGRIGCGVITPGKG